MGTVNRLDNGSELAAWHVSHWEHIRQQRELHLTY